VVDLLLNSFVKARVWGGCRLEIWNLKVFISLNEFLILGNGMYPRQYDNTRFRYF